MCYPCVTQDTLFHITASAIIQGLQATKQKWGKIVASRAFCITSLQMLSSMSDVQGSKLD